MSESSPAAALAVKFHDAYERLAPEHGYTTREETRQFNAETPNGKLMVAVCKDLIANGVIAVLNAQPEPPV
jgi:hypothetical protein